MARSAGKTEHIAVIGVTRPQMLRSRIFEIPQFRKSHFFVGHPPPFLRWFYFLADTCSKPTPGAMVRCSLASLSQQSAVAAPLLLAERADFSALHRLMQHAFLRRCSALSVAQTIETSQQKFWQNVSLP